MSKKEWIIEYMKPVDLLEHPRNPRYISKERFKQLKKNIKSQGFRVPPTVDNEYTLLAGHQRVKALIDLGLGEEDIPISVPKHDLTEDERREILASDNLSFGEYDWDIINSDFEPLELNDWGFDDKMLTGWGDDEEENKQNDLSDKLGDKFVLEIEFESEIQLKKMYDEMTKKGYQCKILTL